MLFALELVSWTSTLTQPKLRYALLTLMLLLNSALSSAPDTPTGIDQDPAGQAAVRWLKENTKSRASIISSYENAPLAYLSGRKWQQYPSPWENKRRAQATYLILSSLDSFWIGPDPTLDTPLAYFGGEEQWVAIFSLKNSSVKTKRR